MAQQATNVIPPKGLWTLKIKDFINGAVVACTPQLLVILDFWNNSDHWPTHEQWQPYIKMTIYTFCIYILKNFSTNNVGQLFRKDKAVVAIDKEELNQLQSKTN